MSGCAIVLLIFFFITSADSATYVLAMNTSQGNLNPPNWKKAFWGVLIAVMAAVLILSGGLSTIQIVSIVFAFPYIFLLLLLTAALFLALRREKIIDICHKKN